MDGQVLRTSKSGGAFGPTLPISAAALIKQYRSNGVRKLSDKAILVPKEFVRMRCSNRVYYKSVPQLVVLSFIHRGQNISLTHH